MTENNANDKTINQENLIVHKENFLKYVQEKYLSKVFSKSTAIKKDFGEIIVDHLQNNTKIDAKLKFKIKKRCFCLINIQNVFKLATIKNKR
jgi:hypothetical protein